MSRQTHWDATVGNRRQSPAPYRRKHRASTFLPVPHAPHGYGQLTQKGLFPYLLPETVKVFPVLIPCGSRRELDFAVEKKNLSQNCWDLNFAVSKQIRNFTKNNVISQLFVYFARTGALPQVLAQDAARREGASLACVVPRNGQHPVVPLP